MTSRRKFVIQGGLATAAILALKPFQSFAGSAFSNFNPSSNKLVFLHTTSLDSSKESQVINMLADFKRKDQNVILLKATKDDETNGSLKYDATFQSSDVSLSEREYKTFYKGSLKIGIVGATTGNNNVIEDVNRLAFTLKNSQGCDVVVCLSQLGYKNSNHIDDVTLAAQSSCIDIIIGGHPDNVAKNLMIAINRKNAEVIIDSSTGNSTGISSINLNFNNSGQKQLISFNEKAIGKNLA